jgi:hypothetical protein
VEITSSTGTVCHQGKRVRPASDQAPENHDRRKLGLESGTATSLAPGATGWLTVTFDVMVRCPGPLPVQFRVTYLQAGRLVTADFDSFPDLGPVRYNNCATDAAASQPRGR